nr:MAG TPA: hypothetical protein [Caudoviricetes sp.]
MKILLYINNRLLTIQTKTLTEFMLSKFKHQKIVVINSYLFLLQFLKGGR